MSTNPVTTGRALAGRVAIVTGASRGIGRGIALGLGEAGATVYAIARSLGNENTSGSLQHTAQVIHESGGTGIAVACDLRDEHAIAGLVERVVQEQRGVDVLVNSAIGLPSPESGPMMRPFWELATEAWDSMHDVGFRSNFLTSARVAPHMISAGQGLIVHISSYGAVRYHFNVPYHAAKAGVDKMTRDMAYELRPYGVTVVSLWPDVVISENVIATPELFNLRKADTAIFIGRLIAALAADPATVHKSGMALGSFELGRDLKILDPLPPELRNDPSITGVAAGATR